MSIWMGVKRGVRAIVEGEGPSEYIAVDKVVMCPHCEHTEFIQGSAQLNSAGMSFLGLDWANKSATTLMCDRCGFIMWFGISPNRIQSKET